MRQIPKERPEANALPLLIDEDKAAALLGLSPRTLQRWRCAKVGPPFVRIGRRRLYRPVDLESYIAAGVVGCEAV